MDYALYLDEGGWMSQRDDVSQFWADIFRERRNYPDFNDMLMMRRGSTYPLADRGAEAASSRESEFQHAQAAYFVMSQSMPTAYLHELQESALGCPVCFDFQGRMFSAGAITNALTSYRITEWCKSTGLVNRPLRILEIGAGYGQAAYQLFQQLKIDCYTICDLPENLFLSSFYLQANFPDKKAVFVKENGISRHEQAELAFVAPPFLKTLQGPFDLVINSYSFQEMNRASVDEYFDFVDDTLAPDGLFYSLNAHRKAGVIWPSDYPVERFKVISLQPVRKFPFQVFATNPYEIVMTKLMEDPLSAEAVTRFKRQFDGLGGALQLGLHEELLEICRNLSQCRMDREESAWLENLGNFLQESEYSGKREIVEKMQRLRILPAVTAYLAGNLEFAYGLEKSAKIFLDKAVESLSDSHARARSYLMLACLHYSAGDSRAGDAFCSEAKRIVPHLAWEISRLVADFESLSTPVAYQLHLDLTKQSGDLRTILGRVRSKIALAKSWASQLLAL
jgi:putative sugar O-methyltransferase